MNNDIGKGYAGAKSRPERLEHGLLGGEPAGKAFDSIRPIANLGEFRLNEAARDERIARILNPPPQLGDVYQINTVPNDVHPSRHSLVAQAAAPFCSDAVTGELHRKFQADRPKGGLEFNNNGEGGIRR